MLALSKYSLRLMRQANILVNHNTAAGNARAAVTACSRLVPLPVITATTRHAHKGLYQMVKKRTLEARTKLQPSKYPNNQPCVASQPTSTNKSHDRPPVPFTPRSASSTKQKPLPSSSSKSPPSDPSKLPPPCPPTKTNFEEPPPELPSKSICENTKMLSGKTAPKCPPRKADDCSDKPSGVGPGGDPAKDNKWLWLLLAALGAGGLLLWMLFGGKKEEDEVPAVAENKCGTADVKKAKTIPASSAELPKHVPYLLIGGGTAAFSAFRAIKANDPKAKVLMITDEMLKPYMRPPLSKELWYSAKAGDVSPDLRFKQWTGAERSLFFEPDEFFMDPTKLEESINGGIAIAHGFAVKKVDPDKHIVTLCDGYEIGYDECLIATGSSPKNLNVFINAPPSVQDKVMVYRSPCDFERLKRYADEKKTICIIGNGFTGSELACSLANYTTEKGAKVYQVYPENGNMSRVLPEYLSRWTTKKVEALGVCVLPNTNIREVVRDQSKLKLVLTNGTIIMADVAVVCIGSEANTQMAPASGLEVDRNLGGFVVNAELEARRNLFVAGDASCFYDPLLGRRRVEHHDHSVVSGRLAGENMVGKKKAYAHQSMFWSDLGPEVGYEGIGLVDSSLPTVAIFALPSKTSGRTSDNLVDLPEEEKEYVGKSSSDLPDVNCNTQDQDQYGRGVVFYLKDNKIVGILLWNLFNRIGLARTIINQNKKYDDLNEVAKLFEIHS